MATNGKRKGKDGELEAVKLLKELGFPDAKRTVQYNGLGKGDVECPESLPNVHIEVKRDKALDIGNKLWWDAIVQADTDAGDKEWCVLWRKDGGKLWRLTFSGVYGVVTVDHSRIKSALLWLEGGCERTITPLTAANAAGETQ